MSDVEVVPVEQVDLAAIQRGLTLASLLSCDVPITPAAQKELTDAHAALARLAALETATDQGEVERLAGFGAEIFDVLWDSFTDGQWEIEVSDLVTETALKAGLVTSVDFDPDKHDDPLSAFELGDNFYLISPAGREALKRARAALQPKEQGK